MHRLSRVARSAGVLAVGVGILGLVYWYVTPHDEPPPPPPPPPVTASVTASAPPPPAPLSRGCRVVGIEGRATRLTVDQAVGRALGAADAGAGPFVATGEALDGSQWVALDQPGFAVPRLMLKDARSGREVAFSYGALVRPCIGDGDAWLVTGRYRALGGGDAPGNEAWVVTPLGAVRGGVAVAAWKKSDLPVLEVRLDAGAPALWLAKGVDVELRPVDEAGDAAPPAPSDAGPKPKAPAPETVARLQGSWMLVATVTEPLGTKETLSALTACEREARAAASAAAAIASPGRGVDGAEVAAHMTRRLAARAACSVAELRLALQPGPAGDGGAGLAARLEEAKKSAFSGASP
ncbi:MAG: hypothetical protein JNL38_07510 [Myxococcales bacterium]|nr:hypothetical protein [Myxococcales bacterium]